jgi:hypothetical protein
MPRLFVLIAFALAASGVETEELTEQVESSVAALLQREYDVLKEHFLLRNTELPKGANAFMRELAGQLILRTVLACCTPRSRTRRLSAATSEVQPTDTTSLPSKFCSRGLAFFWTRSTSPSRCDEAAS